MTDPQRSFLLSAAAKALLPREAARLKSDEAYERFKDIRWGWTDGRTICPSCENEGVYEFRTRGIFKCKRCGKQFSATSGTVFNSRKMPFGTLVFSISMRVHSSLTPMDLARESGLTYRAAWEHTKKLSIFTPKIKTSEQQWPYIASNMRRSSADDLIKEVSKVTARLPADLRADIAQDMILGVLSGDITRDQLRQNFEKYISRYYKSYDNRFACVSWDAPVPGTDSLRWDEIISTDHTHF